MSTRFWTCKVHGQVCFPNIKIDFRNLFLQKKSMILYFEKKNVGTKYLGLQES